MNLKPIETHYKGYRFRSRLEARWAVFLDALGNNLKSSLKWEYESEGFDLDGVYYLPDFKLTISEIGKTPAIQYLEVKPSWDADDPVCKEAFIKMGRLAEATHVPVVLAVGTPGDSDEIYVGFEDGKVISWTGNNLRSAAWAISAARSARFEFGESGAPTWSRP